MFSLVQKFKYLCFQIERSKPNYLRLLQLLGVILRQKYSRNQYCISSDCCFNFNYGTFINYTHMFYLLVIIETTITGMNVFYSKGYLSKIVPLTHRKSEELLLNNQNYRSC